MASKSLFKSLVGLLAPKADVRNEAGGTAYSFSDQHKLAQYAATGCLNQTFYESADQQLATVLELCAANGQVYVFPDISGSMQSPVTGHRAGSTTAAKCIDIAALVAAAVMRNNPQTVVVPFSDNVIPCQLNPRDLVMTNAAKLMKLPSGGTNCSAPLAHLNVKKAQGDLIIYVSDNESWIDSVRHAVYAGKATETMTQWMAFKRRNPQAKMICIDIQPYGTTQGKESSDIINVGGFSDHVFQLIADVAGGRFSENHWVNEISQLRI